MKRTLCLISVLAVGGCVRDTDDPRTARYAVYDAVLSQIISSRPDATFVVEDRTLLDIHNPDGLPGIIRSLAGRFPTLSQATLEDFRAKNETPSTLEKSFRRRVVLITDREEQETTRDRQGWNRLRERYRSNGIVTFSDVGFNGRMNQAVVYVGHQRGQSDGVGRYVLLIKQMGEWKVKEQIDIWYS